MISAKRVDVWKIIGDLLPFFVEFYVIIRDVWMYRGFLDNYSTTF